MLTHYPDKPHTQNPCFLQEWDDKGTFLCQQKVDGWRLVVIRDKQGRFFYYSRHNKSLAADIEDGLKAEVESLPIPPDSQIDGEWLARRSCSVSYGLSEMIYLFDALKWKGQWLLNKTLRERYALVMGLFVDAHPEHVMLPLEAEPGKFVEFYEAQKKIPYSEGVVVKNLTSKMVGDRRECKKSPGLCKVKWRGSSSGDTDLAPYQTDIRNKSQG